MEPKRLNKILNSYEWKEEEAQISLHFLDHWKTCHLESHKAYGQKLYSVSLFWLIGDYVFEWSSLDEGKRVLRWARDKYCQDKNCFRRKNREFIKISFKIREIFIQILKQDLALWTNQKLKNLFVQMVKLGREQYGYSAIAESADTLAEQDYLNFLPQVAKQNIAEVVQVLSTPGELNVIEREKLALLKMAERASRSKRLKEAVAKKSISALKEFPQFLRELKRHTKNYFWIQNSFRRANYLDEKYFLSSLAEEMKKNLKQERKALVDKRKILSKKRKKISKKYKLTKETKSLFGLIRFFTVLQDRRKENVQRLVFGVDQIFKEIASRFKVSKSDMDNYLVAEVIKILEKDQKVPNSELKKRKKMGYFCYFKNNQIKYDVLSKKDIDKVRKFFHKKRQTLVSAGLIKGFVASLGKGKKMIEGRARLVFDPRQDIFKEGEILVTGMTRPEFVPLMKKAKAIITNEGGITTHAAIVSRELKVPCIIGTRVATEVFKNGDRLRLDLRQGTVKILKN